MLSWQNQCVHLAWYLLAGTLAGVLARILAGSLAGILECLLVLYSRTEQTHFVEHWYQQQHQPSKQALELRMQNLPISRDVVRHCDFFLRPKHLSRCSV